MLFVLSHVGGSLKGQLGYPGLEPTVCPLLAVEDPFIWLPHASTSIFESGFYEP